MAVGARRSGPGTVRSALLDLRPDRCLAAGLGEESVFATKPELAARMVARFLNASHRVAGDEVYGGNPTLRTALEERGAGYVLAAACSHEVTTGAGKFRADTLARKIPGIPPGAGPRARSVWRGRRESVYGETTPSKSAGDCSGLGRW